MTQNIFPESSIFQEHVHAALKVWNQSDGLEEEFLAYLLLVREHRTKVNDSNASHSLRQVTNDILLGSLNELAQDSEEGASILQQRFVQGDIGHQVARDHNISRHQMNRRQHKALMTLAEILWQKEMNLRQIRCEELELELPPATYTRLFGVDGLCEELVSQLIASETHLVILCGIGGIGKTALAHHVTRRAIQHFTFTRILWFQIGRFGIGGSTLPNLTLENLVAALAEKLLLSDVPPTERLKHVRRQLKAEPYLVVIDNLEAETDTTYILAHIAELAEPSKFLLTTRTKPPAEMNALTVAIGEIAAEESIALLNHYVAKSGVSNSRTASDLDLLSIHNVVGGNPLALRLVAGLVSRRLPVEHILENLDYSQLGTGDTLYQRIFWKTWHTLNHSAQILLIAMPLVAEIGTTLEHIRAMSALSDKHLWAALTELMARSLIEVRGAASQPRYAIHRLTENFLRVEVIYDSGKKNDDDLKNFEQCVAANLAYWQTALNQTNSLGLGHLDVERSNIIYAIQFGFEGNRTREAAIELARKAFKFVEHRGHWHEWIPLLQWMTANWSHEDLASKCILLNQLGHLLQLDRQRSEAIEVHRKSEATALQLKDTLTLAHAQFHLSADYYHARQFDKCIAVGQEALKGFLETDDEKKNTKHVAGVLNQLGLGEWAQGNIDSAKGYLLEAAALWRQLDQPTELARSLHNLGLISAEADESEGLDYLLEAISLLDKSDLDIDKVRVALPLGTLYFNQGDYEQAHRIFIQAQELLQSRPGFVYLNALVHNNIGNVLLKKGLLKKAEKSLRKSISLWDVGNEDVPHANTLGTLAQVLEEKKQIEEALQYYDEALQLLEPYHNDARADKLRRETTDLRARLSDSLRQSTIISG